MNHLNTVQQETKQLTANESLRSEDLQTIQNNYQKLLQTIMKSCVNENYEEEPVTKITMRAQADLIDLFYGEIKEMYSKNEMSSKELEKITN